MQLAFADAQRKTDNLLAHTTMNHSNSSAAKGGTVFFPHFCLGRKLTSDLGGDLSDTEGSGHHQSLVTPGSVDRKRRCGVIKLSRPYLHIWTDESGNREKLDVRIISLHPVL